MSIIETFVGRVLLLLNSNRHHTGPNCEFWDDWPLILWLSFDSIPFKITVFCFATFFFVILTLWLIIWSRLSFKLTQFYKMNRSRLSITIKIKKFQELITIWTTITHRIPFDCGEFIKPRQLAGMYLIDDLNWCYSCFVFCSFVPIFWSKLFRCMR